MRILSAVILSFLLLTSCSEEKREVKDPLAIKNKSSADLPKGGIPYEITYFTDLQKKGQTIDEKISIIRDYSIMYDKTDYYNNLFQISVSFLSLDESHKNLSDSDLNFLLDQFAFVESNIVNIKDIPLILKEAYSREMMTNDELMDYSEKIFEKNTEKINGLTWKDDELRKEKLAALKSAKFNAEYYRGRVYQNLAKSE
jgi:hypothetical protein